MRRAITTPSSLRVAALQRARPTRPSSCVALPLFCRWHAGATCALSRHLIKEKRPLSRPPSSSFQEVSENMKTLVKNDGDGAYRDRTDDLRLAKAALSQLS